jgi:multicomponent Na+:H+ antiporter subunit B
MSHRVLVWLYVLFASIFGVGLCFAMAGLPPFGDYRGPYGDLVLQTAPELRQTQQGVAAVTFDYRGFDTLGEEFILFAAVAGALLLLRAQESERTLQGTGSAGGCPPSDHCPPSDQQVRDQASDRSLPEPGAAVIGCGVLMFPFTLLLGMYIVFHGHLSPGGGFQGGVLLASAFYFIYLSGEYGDLLEFVSGHTVGFFEVAGAAGFALIAALPLLRHQPYMLNLLPLGKAGELFSTGTLPLFNCAVGIEVAAAFLLLISAFLRQVLMIRKGKGS